MQQNSDILKYISTLIAEEEFVLAQQEFFMKNCRHFEDGEENKHEYQNIFQEYQKILESSIENKLLERYGENTITKFFEQLENDHKSFQDQETLQTLFSFTDFEHFKKMMIDYGSRIKDEGKGDLTEDKYITKDILAIKKYFELEDSKWKHILKAKEQDGLQVYSTPFEKTGLNIMKTVQTIKNRDPHIVDWKYIKKVSQNESFSQLIHKVPMLSTREYISHQQLVKQGDNKYYYQSNAVDLPDYPINPKIVRAELYYHLFFEKIAGKDDVKLITYLFNDIKGYMPKMFMNMTMSTICKQKQEELGVYSQEEEQKLRK